VVVKAISRINMNGIIEHQTGSTILDLAGGSLQFTPALPGGIGETDPLQVNVSSVTTTNNSVTLSPTTLTFSINNPTGSFAFQVIAGSFAWVPSQSTANSTVITGAVQLLGTQTLFTVSTTQFSLSGFTAPGGGSFSLRVKGAVIHPGGDGTWVQTSPTITASYAFGPAIAPEPASLALAITGLGGLGLWRCFRRRSRA
jgi:MYXO-CTERM domain-containing protein